MLKTAPGQLKAFNKCKPLLPKACIFSAVQVKVSENNQKKNPWKSGLSTRTHRRKWIFSLHLNCHIFSSFHTVSDIPEQLLQVVSCRLFLPYARETIPCPRGRYQLQVDNGIATAVHFSLMIRRHFQFCGVKDTCYPFSLELFCELFV